jgi:hypothetical protein
LGSGGSGGLLDSKNLILAGDLNFTLGADEVWGAATQLDKLVVYFNEYDVGTSFD